MVMHAAPPQRWSLRRALRWVPVALVSGFALVVVYLRYTTYDSVIVLGDSMEPTLYDSDRLIALKHPYPDMKPRRGDIVVVRPNDGPVVVKRVVATQGEEVAIINRQLYVNRRPCKEDYLKEPMQLELPYGPLIVPKDHVYVLGDNRNRSEDSRDYGPLPYDRVTGLVVYRIWPLRRMKRLGH